MFALASSDVTTVIAAMLTGLLGLLPWWLERSHRRTIQDDNRRRIWSDVSKIRGLMLDLEKDEMAGAVGPGAQQATGKLTIMLRDLLREACAAEPRINMSVVRKWRASGKLASEWQEQLVLMLLHADEITDEDVEALPTSYASKDELPPMHTMSATRESEGYEAD